MSGVGLVLGSLDPAVTVSVAPPVSVLALLTDAARGRFAGMPAPLAGVARQMLREADPAVLGALAGVVPATTLLPVSPVRDVGMAEHLDALRSPGLAERLPRDLHDAFDGEVSVRWRHAVERPASWLAAYASTTEAAWRVFGPVWRRAKAVIAQDIERVAVAAARRQHAALLAGLSPMFTVGDGVPLGERGVVLVPMLAGERALLCDLGAPQNVWLGYPVRARRKTPNGESLNVVLGKHRATILRLLDEPCNVTGLAEAMYFAPSTLNYHCNLLVEAELIARSRHGREIRLSRTARGTELLAVLG